MLQLELSRMKAEAFDAKLLTQAAVHVEVAIHIITDQRMLTRRSLNADLMRAARDEVDVDP